MSASGTPRLALLALAALSLIWGYNWVVMKQVIQYVDPFDFSAIRTVLGAATLFLVLLVLRKPMSLVAARALARAGSRRLALIGNGAQGEFQALAFHHGLDIAELCVFDVDKAATDRLVRNLAAAAPGLRIQRAGSVAAAVRGADIVTTATANKARASVLTPDMVEPGMHLNAIGGDCPGKTELHAEVLRSARIFVEYEPQTRTEGEIQQLPADHPVTELWRVLTRQAPGRTTAQEVTVFDSVGFALEDFCALQVLHQLAQERSVGHPIALVPTDGDPKDLFGRTRDARAPVRLRRVA